MSDDNYVNHVPVMTGGRGRDEMLTFYGRHFIPKMPADTRLTPVCRTVGQERVIDEMIFAFTHDIVMDWMLPGVAPTGRRRRGLPRGTGGSAGGKQRAAQNVTDRTQPAELTLARFSLGNLDRKSSMFLIWFSRRKDWVTRTPGNTTSLLPS